MLGQRWLPLFFALAACAAHAAGERAPGTPAVTAAPPGAAGVQVRGAAPGVAVVHFRDAAATHFGKAQLHFLDALIAAKRAAPTSPVRSLIESSLWVYAQDDAPPLALDEAALGEARSDDAWLAYAEALCADARFEVCALALARVPEARHARHRARIDALLARLAQAGYSPPRARWESASDVDAAAALNQVLALLAAEPAGAAKQRDQHREAGERLRRIAAQASVSPTLRQRALLWQAMLLRDGGQAREAAALLAEIDGGTSMLADALLVWLSLHPDAEPAVIAAVEQHLAAELPASPAAWEAREHLIDALLRRGAHAQAARLAVDGAAGIAAELDRFDQHIGSLERASGAALIQTLSLLPDNHRHRVGTLFERRANLQAAERALNGWMPYVFSYHNRLQDPAKFADEVGKAVAQAAQGAGEGGGDEDARALFSFRLARVLGEVPDAATRDRLFAGLANWSAAAHAPDARGAGYAPDWRAGEVSPAMLAHAGAVEERLGGMRLQAAEQRYREVAVRIRGLVAANQQQVREVRETIEQIDAAIRREVIAGLRERRRVVQQWLTRFAYHAYVGYQRHDDPPRQPVYELGAPLALKPGQPLVRSLAQVVGGSSEQVAAPVDPRGVWTALRAVIERGEDRAVRADALRVRAALTLALYEARALPTPREAVQHYETLLADYADLTDAADAYYQLARVYDLSAQSEAVERALTAFVARFGSDPRAADARFRLAELHYGFGDFEKAKRGYQGVLQGGEAKYREQAEYKLGWSLFKQGEHRQALPHFMAVIERGLAGNQDRLSVERTRDAQRAASLTFSYLDGPGDIERYFAKGPKKPYVADLYAGLAQLYLERDRINDAARTYEHLVRHHPDDPRAPQLLAGTVKGAREEGLTRLALDLQEQYIERYGKGGGYWTRSTPEARSVIDTAMQPMLGDMARLYHADAQSQGNPGSRNKAIRYYAQYIDTFPQDQATPELHFLLGEARFEAGDTAGALVDYEAAAYRYGPHGRAAEAGYATLIASQKLAAAAGDTDTRKRELRALALRSDRFAAGFPGDARVEPVLAKAGEDLLQLGEPAEAARLGEALLARKPDEATRRRATLVVAHGHFEAGAFGKAETAYAQALALRPEARQAKELNDRLGLAVYRQAEAQRAGGQAKEAIDGFLRVARTAPGAEAIPNAEIDAAALLLESKRWRDAIDVLERFGKNHPTHPLGADVPTRLAYAYENDGRYLPAADLLESISQRETDDALARQTLWRAAELRDKGGRRDLTLATWERYLKRYPSPLERASEVRQLLADAAGKSGDKATRDRWLNDIIATHAKGGGEATVRVAYLAARANLVQGDDQAVQFDALKLKLPLDKALTAKRKALQDTLKWYDGAGRYGIAEVTTAATYKTAELYRRLAKDLIASDRPSGLTALEREQYDILLEEEAFPFEEKATQLHEVNHRRLQERIHDAWVKQSMSALAALLPAKYDRPGHTPAWFAYEPPKPEPPKSEPGKTGQPATPATSAVVVPGATGDRKTEPEAKRDRKAR